MDATLRVAADVQNADAVVDTLTCPPKVVNCVMHIVHVVNIFLSYLSISFIFSFDYTIN